MSSGRLLGLSIAAAVIVYAPTLRAAFQGDDFELLLRVRELGPFGAFSQSGAFFRPLVSLSLYLNQQIGGLHAWSYHLTNVVAHGVCTFLVYAIARSLLARRAPALLSAILFLLLPAHAEAVSWIAGRGDVLATCGALGAFWACLRFRQAGQRRWLVIAAPLFGLALLCKEAVITLPIIVLVHERFIRESSYRRPAASVVLFAMAIFHVLLRRLFIGVWIGGYGTEQHLHSELPLAIRGALFALLRAFFPQLPGEYLPASGIVRSIHQVIAQGHLTLREGGLFLALFALPTVTAVHLVATLWRLRQGRLRMTASARQRLGFTLMGFGLALMPMMTLGRAISLTDCEGGRLIYFPSVFAMIWLTAWIDQFVIRGRQGLFAFIILIYGWSLIHTERNYMAASEIAQRIIEQSLDQAGQLRQTEPANTNSVTLINQPDSLNGAYIFRTNLDAAWRLYGGRGPAPRSLSTHTLHDVSDVAFVRQLPNAIEVELPDPQNYFRPLGIARIVVPRSPAARSELLLYFSAGNIHRLR